MLTPLPQHPDRRDRESLLGQRGVALWLTGLSGSGKSTLARGLQKRLHAAGRLVQQLDGDALRQGLCADLDFSAAARSENIRRASEVAALLVDTGAIVVASFISPYRADRQRARDIIGHERFLEIYLDVPLAICEARDPKGLYRRARSGAIRQFTGIDAPYEPPEAAHLTLPTGELSLEDCLDRLVDLLARLQFLSDRSAGDKTA
jgi:adenylylsulfate kinase